MRKRMISGIALLLLPLAYCQTYDAIPISQIGRNPSLQPPPPPRPSSVRGYQPPPSANHFNPPRSYQQQFRAPSLNIDERSRNVQVPRNWQMQQLHEQHPQRFQEPRVAGPPAHVPHRFQVNPVENIIIHLYLNSKDPSNPQKHAEIHAPVHGLFGIETASGIRNSPIVITKEFDRKTLEFVDTQNPQSVDGNIVEVKATVSTPNRRLDRTVNKAVSQELERAIPMVMNRVKMTSMDSGMRRELEEALVDELAKNLGDTIDNTPDDVNEDDLAKLIEQGLDELQEEEATRGSTRLVWSTVEPTTRATRLMSSTRIVITTTPQPTTEEEIETTTVPATTRTIFTTRAPSRQEVETTRRWTTTTSRRITTTRAPIQSIEEEEETVPTTSRQPETTQLAEEEKSWKTTSRPQIVTEEESTVPATTRAQKTTHRAEEEKSTRRSWKTTSRPQIVTEEEEEEEEESTVPSTTQRITTARPPETTQRAVEEKSTRRSWETSSRSQIGIEEEEESTVPTTPRPPKTTQIAQEEKSTRRLWSSTMSPRTTHIVKEEESTVSSTSQRPPMTTQISEMEEETTTRLPHTQSSQEPTTTTRFLTTSTTRNTPRYWWQTSTSTPSTTVATTTRRETTKSAPTTTRPWWLASSTTGWWENSRQTTPSAPATDDYSDETATDISVTESSTKYYNKNTVSNGYEHVRIVPGFRVTEAPSHITSEEEDDIDYGSPTPHRKVLTLDSQETSIPHRISFSTKSPIGLFNLPTKRPASHPETPKIEVQPNAQVTELPFSTKTVEWSFETSSMSMSSETEHTASMESSTSTSLMDGREDMGSVEDSSTTVTVTSSSAVEVTPSSTIEITPSSTVEVTPFSTMEASQASTREASQASTMEASQASTMEASQASTMEASQASTMVVSPSSTMEIKPFSTIAAFPSSTKGPSPSSTRDSLPSSTTTTGTESSKPTTTTEIEEEQPFVNPSGFDMEQTVTSTTSQTTTNPPHTVVATMPSTNSAQTEETTLPFEFSSQRMEELTSTTTQIVGVLGSIVVNPQVTLEEENTPKDGFNEKLMTDRSDTTSDGLVQLECLVDGFKIFVSPKFHGVSIVKGYQDDVRCKATVTRNGAHMFVANDECGVTQVKSRHPDGVNSSIVLNLLHDTELNTGEDRAYLLQCFVGVRSEEHLETNLDVDTPSELMIAETISLASLPPTCHYTIRKDRPDGPIVSRAHVGETVYHRWQCDGTNTTLSAYGLHVHTCYASDDIEKKRALLDTRGCSSDRALLSDVSYDENSLTAYAASRVFSVHNAESLKFVCDVSLCTRDGADNCIGVTPPLCDNREDAPPANIRRDSALTSALTTSVDLTRHSGGVDSMLNMMLQKNAFVIIAIAAIASIGVFAYVMRNDPSDATTTSCDPSSLSASSQDISISDESMHSGFIAPQRNNPELAEFMRTFDRSRYV